MATKKNSKSKNSKSRPEVEYIEPPTYPVFNRKPEDPPATIAEIHDGLKPALHLARLIKQEALECVVYATAALDLEATDFTAASDGEFDDDDDEKMRLVSNITAMVEWSVELHSAMELAVRRLWKIDEVAQAEFKAASEKWDRDYAEYKTKKAAYEAKKAGGK